MNRQELIDQLIIDTKSVKAAVQEMSQLPIEQLSFKPEHDRWSVLQCVEHLNIADEHYLMQFYHKLRQAPKSPKENFKSGIMGKYFTKAMKPKADGSIPSPMKTMKKFRPEIDVKMDTIEKFINDQDKIIESLELSRTLDLNKNKIPSAIGSIVTFKLGDAFRFLVAHNQRHVQQMRNVLALCDQSVDLAS